MNIFPDLSRIHLFIYVIYLSMHSRCFCCCCSSARDEHLPVYLSRPSAPSPPTARSVSLWQYEFNRQPPPFTICLPLSSLALLPPPPPLLVLCLLLLLLLHVGIAAVCVMRFQCRRVDFSWRPAKECQYYLSSLVCFSMDRPTAPPVPSLLLWVSRSSGHKSMGC